MVQARIYFTKLHLQILHRIFVFTVEIKIEINKYIHLHIFLYKIIIKINILVFLKARSQNKKKVYFIIINFIYYHDILNLFIYKY